MHRRNFIQAFTAFATLLGLAPACTRKNKIRGTIVGASAHIGHLLRNKNFDQPVEDVPKDVVIVGAGISGLSAAYTLQKEGINDFIVLDLESKVGGNAVSGTNAVSSYPWGAHYVPIPNNSMVDYIKFLKEAGVITGTDETGLPVYNEYFLCFDPQERLYINGRWQEGLVPQFGVPDNERKQIQRFLNLMEDLRHASGSDGKEAFALPVDQSSKDAAFVHLDDITMKEWMHQQGFDSVYLDWYIDYCTRDDFGTPFHQVSAWAGIHYFASRKGKGVNVTHSDVLTWPEGNGWLAEQLQKKLNGKIYTRSMAVAVKPSGEGVSIHYLDVYTKQMKAIHARQCILAVPQFVACRLLNDKKRTALVQEHLHYVPWMVANITVKELQERSGAPLSWDNVIYDSHSLGYVHATHELLNRHLSKRNLTYYLPLTLETPSAERKRAQLKTFEQWVGEIMTDLKKIHPNIGEAIEEINIMLWGHAMAQPRPGLIHGPVRNALSASIDGRIHFAHTDLAGISVFEEAFYQGLNAAKKVITKLS